MNGILLVDKPEGLSSAGTIRMLKSAARGRRRCGHLGTLDPFASGLAAALHRRGDQGRRLPAAGAQGIHGHDPPGGRDRHPRPHRPRRPRRRRCPRCPVAAAGRAGAPLPRPAAAGAADVLGAQARRRPALQARPAGTSRSSARRATSRSAGWSSTPRGRDAHRVRARVLEGHLRAGARRRSRARPRHGRPSRAACAGPRSATFGSRSAHAPMTLAAMPALPLVAMRDALAGLRAFTLRAGCARPAAAGAAGALRRLPARTTGRCGARGGRCRDGGGTGRGRAGGMASGAPARGVTRPRQPASYPLQAGGPVLDAVC